MINEDELNKSFNCSFPALELPNKHYSLEADIVTGWKPKMKLIGPVPLSFDSPIIDSIVDELTAFGRKHKERVIYLGYRYASSFRLQQEIKKNYHYKYEGLINTNFAHLAAYFRKFHSGFNSKNGRLFKGMNPTVKVDQEPTFDSNFEGGNLDVVIKVGDGEYDCCLRVDSNTHGHVQWYHFSVKNNGRKRIKIHITNFRKHKTLYDRGLRPYVYSEAKGGQWEQGGINVHYGVKRLRYSFLLQTHYEQALDLNCLSFEYQFCKKEQTVHFAYCPPFTYSQNLSMIAQIHSQLTMQSSTIMLQEMFCQSLGGLEIPLLTITDPQIPNHDKKCIVGWARIHPGETCGSHVMKGFIEFVTSQNQEAKYLRKKVVFKLIPMVNPDGVIVGNFRTSFGGRDLNRMFKSDEALLIPEVKGLKDLVNKLKLQFKNKMLFFLDFHGHSVRKNVFLYGPQYEIWEPNYYKTRILPKLIDKKTEIFRYYSCLFRISQHKKTTARAVILKQIPHCYTIEASVGSYYSPQLRKDMHFSVKDWQNMGSIIADSIKQYLQIMEEEHEKKEQKAKERKQKEKEKERGKQSLLSKGKREIKPQEQIHEKIVEKKLPYPKVARERMSERVQRIMEEIDRDKQMQIAREGHDSDRFSSGKSDSELDEDYNEKQFQHLHNQIREGYKEMNVQIPHENKGQEKLTIKVKKCLRSSMQFPQRAIEMIASLRKRAQNDSPRKDQRQNAYLKQLWEKNRLERLRRIQIQKQQSQLDLSGSNFMFRLQNLSEECAKIRIRQTPSRKSEHLNSQNQIIWLSGRRKHQ